MLTYRQQQLFIEGSAVESLAKKFGTPLFVYSKNALLDNYCSFDEALAPVSHLTCYAVKANSNYSVLSLLARRGAGADITSGGELYRALEAGFSPKKVVYAGIGKSAEEIDYALSKDILLFNVESIEELEQIDKIAARRKKKAPVAFRINPHVDPHTHRYITTGTSGVKFGIPYGDALAVYKKARRMSNIDVAGIHSHIGSQITSTGPFKLAAKKMAALVRRIEDAGMRLRYVDLGGGLGINYNKETPPSPEDLAKAVLPEFGYRRSDLAPESSSFSRVFGGTFLFEPGRFIVGNAGVLIAKVIYRKSAGGKNFLVVDTGMNDLVRPTLYEAYHDILPVKSSKARKASFDVVGPICETGDFLGKNRLLPWLEQGQYLAVRCAGAYGFAMSSQYNSRLRAAEVMVDGSRAEVVRKREDYRDLTYKEAK